MNLPKVRVRLRQPYGSGCRFAGGRKKTKWNKSESQVMIFEKGKDQVAFYADLATRRLRKLSASI
jgi:hypothetical protein